FAAKLRLPPGTVVVSKAERPEQDAYSGFEGTDLDARLKRAGVRRVFVGGLATDYCVLNTVRDARKLSYDVFLLTDGARAVNVQSDNGRKAEEEMRRLGARPIEFQQIAA
ncbi:MAG TPA: isochorismatase family protein, partial [Burkholderiales bacterium]|nr:isochorismatase family protein [Burkholderiales bacterium]